MAAVTFNEALEARARKVVQDRINRVGQQLATGNMPTFEQYKYHCGIIKGLQEALDILEQSLKDIQTAGRGDLNSG